MIRPHIKTFLIESNKIEPDVGDDEEAHEQAFAAWEWLQDQDVERADHDLVKGIHREILKDRQPDIAGEYRDCRVRVGGYTLPNPEEVPGLMDVLLDRSRTPLDPSDAIRWHVAFEQIHPFRDGNGRTGRMIYAWQCVECLDVLPLIFRAKDKRAYYDLFRGTVQQL